MGNSQSSGVAAGERSTGASPVPRPQPNNVSPKSEASAYASPMETLIADASAYGNDESESLEAKAQKALECPCVAELRNGPCGAQFTEAFLCFMKSTEEEKGSDCVNPFIALQDCIKENKDAFVKDILEDEDDDDVEQESQEFKIVPPIWAKETRSNL